MSQYLSPVTVQLHKELGSRRVEGCSRDGHDKNKLLVVYASAEGRGDVTSNTDNKRDIDINNWQCSQYSEM